MHKLSFRLRDLPLFWKSLRNSVAGSSHVGALELHFSSTSNLCLGLHLAGTGKRTRESLHVVFNIALVSEELNVGTID